MFFKLHKNILSIFLIVLFAFSFSACGKKDNESFSSVSVETGVEDVSAVVSKENDIVDPENKDIITEEGTKVKAEELVRKTGKANGIDVSKWQGKIDWQKVKKSGIDFAIIRVGYRGEDGKIYKDSYADYNIQQADKVGILVGAYFFSTAVNKNEAIEEAKWLASAIEGYPISYPVIYNCEGFLNGNSRMNSLTKTDRTDNAIAFLSFVEEKGYEGMFYAAKTELENSLYWETPKLENSFMIWVARYPSVPYPKTESPDYSGKYDMWQYTDKGSVNGISANTDMIVSYFTRDKKAPKNSNITHETAVAPNPDDKLYTKTDDEVTAKIEVNLRKAATTKSDVVAVLKNGTFLKRIAEGTNGWSKLEYEGKTVYAITSYLTTDRGYKPPQSEPSVVDDGFTASSGQVTAKDTTNLRSEPSENAKLIATIKNGEFVERIAVNNQKGWTRLSYNGQTVYAKTSLLTTEVNNVTSTVGDGFTASSGQVTAKDTTNLRSEPSEKAALVATIKNGEFVERLGVSPKGWTKLSYNGQTVYAKTSLLTTEVKDEDAPPKVNTDNFTPMSGRVTAKLSETNLRTGPTVNGTEIVYTLKKGEFVERTGERNGWTRVSYNGQTLYAVSSYLITEQEYNAE